MSMYDDLNYLNKSYSIPVSNYGLGDYLGLAMLGSLPIRSKNPSFWFVDPGGGSDAYDGDNWYTPFQTIQAAVDAAGDGRGDIIFLLSGRGTDYDDDTVGASQTNAYVYINKSDISLIGLGPPNSVIIKPDAAATAGVITLGVTAERVHIANLTINTTTAQSEAIVAESGAHYPTVENCIFDLVGASGPLGYGVRLDVAKVSYPMIRNCTFYVGAHMAAAIAIKCQDATPFGALIENCRIISTAAANPCADGILIADGTGAIIKDVHITGGVAAQNIVDGIDIDAGVLQTQISGCTIGTCDNAVTDGGTDTTGETAGEGYIDTTHA